MRIGILKADSVLPELSPRHGDYSEMFPTILRTADPTLEFQCYDVEHDEYPARLDECDGYLITGSRYSVYDDEEWIRRLREWVTSAARTETRIVGVCFGHQLVADALGGRTEKAEVGWTIGNQRLRIDEPFPWTDDGTREIGVLHSHQDQVTRLPTGARRVGGNERCPNAFYFIGDRIMCCQGHPEFTTPYARELYAIREKVFGPAIYGAALDSMEQEPDHEVLARWIVTFLAGR